MLGFCQMFGKGLSNLRLGILDDSRSSDARPLKPDFNFIVCAFNRAEMTAEEYTYLRYIVLFNSGKPFFHITLLILIQ